MANVVVKVAIGVWMTVVVMVVVAPVHGQQSIGVNYGRVADNLPSPTQVVQLLQSRGVKHARIYDTNPTVLGAFANSGIDLGVTIPNADIALFAANPSQAALWVQSQLQPFPSTTIATVAVGNEYLADTSLDPSQLLPAMQNVRQALQNAGLGGIQVSTPHSFSNLIGGQGFPPSAGEFNSDLPIGPILNFLAQQNAPFMVNLYPFFSPSTINLEYALGNADAPPVVDGGNGLVYHSLFDAMVDTVVAAMQKAGQGNVAVLITESGWASAGGFAATVANAQAYNTNLVNNVLGSSGTPVRPGPGHIPTFIFELFNEDDKSAGVEQNFGLYFPNETPVYPVPLTANLLLLESLGSAIDPSVVNVATE